MQEKVIQAIEGEEDLQLALEAWFKGRDEDFFKVVSRENQTSAFKVKSPTEEQAEELSDPAEAGEDEEENEDETEEVVIVDHSVEVVCQGRAALGKMMESARELSGKSIFVEDTDIVLSVGNLSEVFKQGLAVSSFEFIAPASITVPASGHSRVTVYAVFQRHPDSMAQASFSVKYRVKDAASESLFSEVEFEQKKIFAYVLSSIEFPVNADGEHELELLIGDEVLHVHTFTALAKSIVSEATLTDVIERYQTAEPNGE
jgi:hypothetical protein